MLTNRWIADRGYGTGMALAFEGDEKFIEQSINFAVNYLLSDKSQIRQQTPSFVVINTTMDNLRKAFELEGYCLRMRELLKDAVSPMSLMDDDDFPDDWEERVENHTKALLVAQTAKELKELEKKDPMRGLLIEETPEQERDATEWGKQYAERELAKLHFEDFMRHISRAAVNTHAVSEVPV